MTTSESKCRFFSQNESIRLTNRIDSNRELECSTACQLYECNMRSAQGPKECASVNSRPVCALYWMILLKEVGLNRIVANL